MKKNVWKNDILLKSLALQRLAQNLLQNPEEVVAWMGAVQAQDYPGAKWSLGMRMRWDSQPGRDESSIAPASIVEQAFNSGWLLLLSATVISSVCPYG